MGVQVSDAQNVPSFFCAGNNTCITVGSNRGIESLIYVGVLNGARRQVESRGPIWQVIITETGIRNGTE